MIKSERKKDLRKLFKIFSIIGLVLIILGFIVFLVCSNMKSSYRKFYKVGEELIYEQLLYTQYKEVDIETKMTDISIKSSPDGMVKLLVYGEKDYITFKERGDKLFIKINPKDLGSFNLYKYISKIELYLPTGYKKLIRIDSEYGNIDVDDFIDSTLYVRGKYGDILSKGSNFIKIFNDYGNITIDKSIKGRIYSSNSDIKISAIDDLVIENETGDINIDSINKYIKINNDGGNVSINNLVLEEDSIINNGYGDIKIGATNEIYIKSKIENGKTSIKNNNKKSDIVLDLHNKFGNIMVGN